MLRELELIGELSIPIGGRPPKLQQKTISPSSFPKFFSIVS